MRTGGAMEPYTIWRESFIDAGRMPGPEESSNRSYLEARGTVPQMYELKSPEDARKLVEYWAGRRNFIQRFYAYTRAQTGRGGGGGRTAQDQGDRALCAVGFREAAAIGIDNWSTASSSTPNSCREKSRTRVLTQIRECTGKNWICQSEPVQDMIKDLSTAGGDHVQLAVFEAGSRNVRRYSSGCLDAMTPQAAVSYLSGKALAPRARSAERGRRSRRKWEFEYAFVKAGRPLDGGRGSDGQRRRLAGSPISAT